MSKTEGRLPAQFTPRGVEPCLALLRLSRPIGIGPQVCSNGVRHTILRRPTPIKFPKTDVKSFIFSHTLRSRATLPNRCFRTLSRLTADGARPILPNRVSTAWMNQLLAAQCGTARQSRQQTRGARGDRGRRDHCGPACALFVASTFAFCRFNVIKRGFRLGFEHGRNKGNG